MAHLVFTHQIGMTNLLTRAGWQARAADPALHPPFTAAPGEEERIALMMNGVASEVVDYLLFIDEAKLTDRVRGQSGFAERFSAVGPRDRNGRSLHELDLNRRLMKYPCSYLIYSPAFDALPRAQRIRFTGACGKCCRDRSETCATSRRSHGRPPSHRRDSARHEEGPSGILSRARSNDLTTGLLVLSCRRWPASQAQARRPTRCGSCVTCPISRA